MTAPAAERLAATGGLDWLTSTEGTRLVVLGASRDDNAKVTLLLTPPGATRPTLAVKAASTPAAGRAVLAEAAVLGEISRCRLGGLRLTVPTVLAVSTWQGLPALLCEVLPGVPMTMPYHRWRHTARPSSVTDDLSAVLTWCATLQTRTAGTVQPVDWPASLLPALQLRHRNATQLSAAVTALAASAARLATASTPRTAVHGDLWFGNVLRGEHGVTGVVDWEAGQAQGEPLRDIARAVLSYALYLDRHTAPGGRVAGHPGLRADRWGAGVLHLLHGTGWFPDLARGLLGEALSRLGADPRLWRDVVVAGVAEVAVTADESRFATAHLDLLASTCPTAVNHAGGMP